MIVPKTGIILFHFPKKYLIVLKTDLILLTGYTEVLETVF